MKSWLFEKINTFLARLTKKKQKTQIINGGRKIGNVIKNSVDIKRKRNTMNNSTHQLDNKEEIN